MKATSSQDALPKESYMELIERYLQAVKQALPKSDGDDIVQELRDSLLSQIEDREQTLGRALTEDETAELLKKMGSPAKLAAQYREQQGLIGPTVMPIYWKVLKVSLGLSFLVKVIAGIVTAAAGKGLMESLAPILQYPTTALTVFAWVTLTFAFLHFFGAKFQTPDHWDPRKLPPLIIEKRGKSRTEAVAALVIGAIATVWWLVGLRNPFLVMGPGVMFMTFAPIWLKLYPLWVIMGVAEVARHAFNFAKPYATKQQQIVSLVPRCLGLVTMYFLLRAPELFVSNASSPALQPAMASINYGTRLGITIAAVLAVAKLLRDIWKLLSGRLEQAHQAAIGS